MVGKEKKVVGNSLLWETFFRRKLFIRFAFVEDRAILYFTLVPISLDAILLDAIPIILFQSCFTWWRPGDYGNRCQIIWFQDPNGIGAFINVYGNEA